MKDSYSTPTSSAILILIYCLERFSYYGIMGVLVHSLTDDKIGYLSIESFTFHYSIMAILFNTLPFFMGLLSDFFLKRKQTILIGGFIAFLGYLFLIPHYYYLFLVSLILIPIGTGLVKTNLIVMLGRLFSKSDRKRNTTFLFFVGFINLIAFLSLFLLGYIAEEIAFYPAYILMAISTLLYIIIYYFSKDRFLFIEEDTSTSETETQIDNIILDAESVSIQSKSNLMAPFLGIILLIIVNKLFWSLYAGWNDDVSFFIEERGNMLNFMGSFFGFNQFIITVTSLTILVMLLTAFFWQMKDSGSSLSKIAYALFAATLAVIPVYLGYLEDFSNEYFLYPAFSLFILLTFGEALVSAISLSLITRLAPIKYSASIVGFYLFLIYVSTRAWEFASINDYIPYYVFPIAAVIVGILLLVFKKGIIKALGGID